MIKHLAIGSLCIAATLQLTKADTTDAIFDSGSFQIFDNPTLHSGSNVPLTGGNPTVDGDGDVLQLGYYTGATDNNNNFTGTWVPLTGETSLNTAYSHTSIGDRNAFGAGDGTFANSLNFVAADATSGNSLPPAGTILSIRFYNSTTIASSTFYNVVSDDLWKWSAPATPTASVVMSLDDPLLEWYSVFLGQAAGSAFHTTIATAIPEPSTLASLILGGSALALAGSRRRSRS